MTLKCEVNTETRINRKSLRWQRKRFQLFRSLSLTKEMRKVCEAEAAATLPCFESVQKVEDDNETFTTPLNTVTEAGNNGANAEATGEGKSEKFATEATMPEECLVSDVDETLTASPRDQTHLVNKLIKNIGKLRRENSLLELHIDTQNKQNKVLQLRIDIMMKKVEILEGLIEQVKRMEDDARENGTDSSGKAQLCRKCKRRIEKGKIDKSPDLSDADDEEEEILENTYTGEYDGESMSQNPLMIDIIVGNVLSYLPMNMLMQMRLVNRLWNKEATYILKNSQTLTINKDNIEKLPKLMELMSPQSDSDCQSFSSGFLFRHVKFDINFLVKIYREIIENFLGKFGPQIYHFSLHCEQENTSILYTEEVRNIFLPFITNVHNLELSVPTKITERQTIYDDIRPKIFVYENLTKLKLRQLDISLDVGGYSVSIVKELLKLGPHLKSIAVETHTKEVVTRFLLGLGDKECKAIVNQLEELYLDAFITEEHLRLLLPLDFKLKTLQLSYFTVEVTTSMLEALLTKHRTTLQKLIIGDYQKRTTSNSLPLIIKLPTLRELRHLKFVDPLFPDHRQIILNPINYSEQLPSLTELSFDHETGKPTGPHYFQDMFVCSPSPCLTLHTLRISHGLSEPHLAANAVKMFPNLKKLELANAPDAVIQSVWKEFSGLKTLYLHLNPTNLNIDSLMTGIPDQVCRRIQEKNLFSQVDLMNALDIIRTESAICNLTELETLRVDGFTSSLMTAVTGYLALCHMPNLSNLSIKADIITLSRECRRVLGETLHLNLVEFF